MKEPVNDNGSIAMWLVRLFYGASNDNNTIYEVNDE